MMPAQNPSTFSLRRFFWRVLIAMPVCFGVWYFTAFLWTWPVAWLSNAIMPTLFPNLIAGIEYAGATLDIVTNLGDLAKYTENKTMAALVFSINPLIYGYSLALYSALLLASKPYFLKTWLAGMGILMVMIVFGVCFDSLKSIAFDLAPPGMVYPTGFSAWQLTVIGVGYQLGSLVLPAVTPLILWANANKEIFKNDA